MAAAEQAHVKAATFASSLKDAKATHEAAKSAKRITKESAKKEAKHDANAAELAA